MAAGIDVKYENTENDERKNDLVLELGEENMGGCLEEHLNWVYDAHNGWKDDGISGQIDLMLPVKRREK